MFSLGPQRRRTRPSLTPMIDVVFLLLVFFMLAARFGMDKTMALTPSRGSGAGYQGAPRLIEIGAQGALFLNGFAMDQSTIVDRVRALMPSPDDVIVIRPRTDARVQDLVDTLAFLASNDLTNLAVVEAKDAP
jgi:biopolymer transport protein ExbD